MRVIRLLLAAVLLGSPLQGRAQVNVPSGTPASGGATGVGAVAGLNPVFLSPAPLDRAQNLIGLLNSPQLLATGLIQKTPLLARMAALDPAREIDRVAIFPLLLAAESRLHASWEAKEGAVGPWWVSSALAEAAEEAQQAVQLEAERRIEHARALTRGAIEGRVDRQELDKALTDLRRFRTLYSMTAPYLPRETVAAATLVRGQAKGALAVAAARQLWSVETREIPAVSAVPAAESAPSADPASRFSQPLFGVEMEFASERFLQPKAERIDDSHYKKPLEAVKQAFGGLGSAIEMLPFEKFPDRQLRKAVYTDPLGRLWQVVPESVNTTGFDGFELVTPPLLAHDADKRQLARAMRLIQRGKEYGKGLRSATHFTFDVSSLLGLEGNASHLVDAILFIETHWKELYAAASPTRYGTFVNRFSVPLAVDQPDLLADLAAMPRTERTLAKVKAVFERYEQHEIALKGGDRHKAWKYRAANYKKLLGLLGEPQTPIVEFRISDFSTAREVARLGLLFRRALVYGAYRSPNAAFVRPFAADAADLDLLNREIAGQSRERYLHFLETMGLPAEKFPMLGRLGGASALSSGEKTLREALARVDIGKPIEREGKAVTFGFEAEFRGERASRVLDTATMRPLLEKYPYLDSSASKEGTGNFEVRSLGGETRLEEVLSQMKEVRNVLKEDLRGFHLHMRIPKELSDRIPEKELKGWIARIGDYIYAWRLQNRKHFFALKVSTQKRPDPALLNNKRAVRLRPMGGGGYDLEIRGFMTDIARIGETVRAVLGGLQDPRRVKGFYEAQTALNVRELGPREALRRFLVKYEQRRLTPEEETHFRSLAEIGDNYDYHLPLFGFEDAPYLDQLQRERVRNANFNFAKELYTVIRNAVSGKYATGEEMEKQYRWRIKRWALAVDLAGLLRSTLLTDAVAPYEELARMSLEKAKRILASGQDDTKWHALNLLHGRSDAESRELIAQAFASRNRGVRQYAANALRGRTDEESFPLLEKALLDQDYSVSNPAERILRDASDPGSLNLTERALASEHLNVRTKAAYALRQRPGAGAFALLAKALEDPSSDVRVIAAQALSEREEKDDFPLVEKALMDQDPRVRAWALKALKGRQDEGSLDHILRALDDASVEMRAVAVEALQGRTDEGSFPLLEMAFSDRELGVRLMALQALNGRKDAGSLILIQRGLEDPNVETRATATRALEGRADDGSLSLVEKAFSDSEERVREAAIRALQGRTDAASMRLLDRAVQDPALRVREQAIGALANRTDDEVRSVLRRAISHSDGWLREAAGDAIRAWETRRRMAALKPALEAALSQVAPQLPSGWLSEHLAERPEGLLDAVRRKIIEATGSSRTFTTRAWREFARLAESIPTPE